MNARMTRITDCAEVLPGYALKARMEHDSEGTHQVVLAKHLSDGISYDYAPEHELRIVPTGSVDRYKIGKGDVLFVSRGNRNRAVAVETVPDPSVASAVFYILRLHDGVDAGYLAWCLNQIPVQAQIGQVRTGAGMPIVQRKVFAEIRIPLPSLDKQRQLAILGDLMAQEQRIRKNLVVETNNLHRALGQKLLFNLATKS